VSDKATDRQPNLPDNSVSAKPSNSSMTKKLKKDRIWDDAVRFEVNCEVTVAEHL